MERFKTVTQDVLKELSTAIPKDKDTGFPVIEKLAKPVHGKLRQYNALVHATLLLKSTLSEDYYEKAIQAYRKDISVLYLKAFREFFDSLARSTAKSNTFDSRIVSMPDSRIGGMYTRNCCHSSGFMLYSISRGEAPSS